MDDKKYLVFTGNEYGTTLNFSGVEYLSLEKAEDKFQKFYDEYEVAEMWFLGDKGLELVKNKHNFN